MDEASWVVIGPDNAIDSPHGMRHSAAGMLSPTFVQNHPGTNAGMVASGIDEGLILAIEVLHGVFEVAYRPASAARRHVLPNDKAVPVAPVEPKVVL